MVALQSRPAAVWVLSCTLLLATSVDGFSTLPAPLCRLPGCLSTVVCAERPQDRADALVKGVAPPENFGKRSEGGKRASNIQEARELGAKREAAMFDKDDGNFKTTPSGDRYRDIKEGTGAEVTKATAADIKFRVLRLGKRSRDGLSGEASLVFSFGYGEDDDKESDVLRVDPNDPRLVPALQETLLGLRVGGRRRVAAIDVGTAVGLPGGSVTEAENCLDVNRIPAARTFQARRKLARRFDESMLLELEVAAVSPLPPV